MLLDWKKKLCLSHELNDQFIRYIFDLTTTNKFSFDKLDLTCIVRSLWETTIITLRKYVLIRIIYHEIKKSCKNICAFEMLYLKNGINQLKAKYRLSHVKSHFQHSFWWELGTIFAGHPNWGKTITYPAVAGIVPEFLHSCHMSIHNLRTVFVFCSVDLLTVDIKFTYFF